MKAIDLFATKGFNGEEYDWDDFDDLTYSAWLTGRRLRGESAQKKLIATLKMGPPPK